MTFLSIRTFFLSPTYLRVLLVFHDANYLIIDYNKSKFK